MISQCHTVGEHAPLRVHPDPKAPQKKQKAKSIRWYYSHFRKDSTLYSYLTGRVWPSNYTTYYLTPKDSLDKNKRVISGPRPRRVIRFDTPRWMQKQGLWFTEKQTHTRDSSPCVTGRLCVCVCWEKKNTIWRLGSAGFMPSSSGANSNDPTGWMCPKLNCVAEISFHIQISQEDPVTSKASSMWWMTSEKESN